MREPLKDRERFEHMLMAIDRILRYTKGKSFQDLVDDDMMYYAVVKNIEIIGEAANMLTADFRDEHPLTPWREIIAMRNFIVHGYNMVDKNEVVSVIENDLVILKNDIISYIDEINTENSN